MDKKTKHIWIEAVAVLIIGIGFIGSFFVYPKIFIPIGCFGLVLMVGNEILNPYEVTSN